MASRFHNISGLLSDMKSRTIILATGGILVLAVVIGIIGFSRSRSDAQSTAQIEKPPAVQSIPGIDPTSPEYAKLQRQINLKRRQEAQKQAKSFVPTVVGETKGSGSGGGLFGTGGQDGAGGLGAGGSGAGGADGRGGIGGLGAGGAGAGGASGANNGQGKLTPAEEAAREAAVKAQLAALQQQMQQQRSEMEKLQQQQLQQATQKAKQNMTQEARALMTSWSGQGGTASQSFVEGTAATELAQKRQNEAQAAAAAAAQVVEPPIIKAGTILFGSLNTAVNSDEPGPVLATIVSGEYKGSRLIGSIQQSKDESGLDRPTKVTLNFNTMNLENRNKTISINAVAIDPDTARTALASDVDHHYLLRYGSLFASSFMEGYGDAVTQSGQITTNFASGGQTTVTQELDPTEEIAAGFGRVGQRWGEQMDKIFDRPNTITVNAGTSLGILFLTDVSLTAPNVGIGTPLQQNAIRPSASTTSTQNPRRTTIQRRPSTAQQLVTNRSNQ